MARTCTILRSKAQGRWMGKRATSGTEHLYRLLHPAQPAPDGSDGEAFDAAVPHGLWKGNRVSAHGAAVALRGCAHCRLETSPSRSWTINPYACKRLTIDGVYIYSSQKEAVWADGIDPDGCQDVHISNSTIETGDDALVFFPPPLGAGLPAENVTVTNCRLSSARAPSSFATETKPFAA